MMLSHEKLSNRLITIATIAVMLLFICRIVYVGLIAMPYPKNMDDPANIALTETFLGESSPYTLESVDRSVPDINYSYPFMNSAIAVWIVNVFGVAPVNAHFIISLFSILLSGHFGYLIMKRYSDVGFIPFIAGFLFMLCHWNNGFISSSPHDLGMFLYILTLYVVINERIRNKPLWVAILATLCFYTMAVFSLVIIPAVLYMFIRSRRDGLKLVGWTVGINAVIAWFITATWPLYWTRAFVFPYYGSDLSVLSVVVWVIRLLSPPAFIAILMYIGRELRSNREWLDVCISVMAVVIVAFVGLFMLPVHILTDDEIDDWNRAYEYSRIYSTQGQVYYARCLAYDNSFDIDNGDCLCGDDEVINENVLNTQAQIIVQQNLRYRQILDGLARDHIYKLISFDDGFNIFNDEKCKEYKYSMLDRITLRTGNELHEVSFYAPDL